MLKGYRTLIFGASLAVLGFLQTVEWIEFVSEGYVGLVLAGIGAAIMALRAISTTPLGLNN